LFRPFSSNITSPAVQKKQPFIIRDIFPPSHSQFYRPSSSTMYVSMMHFLCFVISESRFRVFRPFGIECSIVRPNLLSRLLQDVIIPLLTLIFFSFAPHVSYNTVNIEAILLAPPLSVQTPTLQGNLLLRRYSPISRFPIQSRTLPIFLSIYIIRIFQLFQSHVDTFFISQRSDNIFLFYAIHPTNTQ
jgi:hypothetical protein